MNKRINDLHNEKIKKLLIKLSLPAIVSCLITAIYNTVDAIFVGSLGNSAIGAVSLVLPLTIFVASIGFSIGGGSASYISRLLGKKDLKTAKETAATGFIFAFVIGLVVIGVAQIFLPSLLNFFGATPTILPYALKYCRIFLIGSIFSIISIFCVNMNRAQGAAKPAMIILIAGAVLNLILDPIFIYVCNLGVSGAALATLLSQILSAILGLVFLQRKSNVIHLNLKYFRLKKHTIGEILKIGLPIFIMQISMCVSMTLFFIQARAYGDIAIASIGIVNRIAAIGYYIVNGISNGYRTVAGYSYGAKQYDRLKKAKLTSILWTTIFCTIFAIIVVVFNRQLISIFTSDPKVIELASKIIKGVCLLFPFFGLQLIYLTTFIALGRAKEGFILSLAREGLTIVPVIIILPKLIGLKGLIFAQPLADLLNLILLSFFIFRFNCFLKKKINEKVSQ